MFVCCRSFWLLVEKISPRKKQRLVTKCKWWLHILYTDRFVQVLAVSIPRWTPYLSPSVWGLVNQGTNWYSSMLAWVYRILYPSHSAVGFSYLLFTATQFFWGEIYQQCGRSWCCNHQPRCKTISSILFQNAHHCWTVYISVYFHSHACMLRYSNTCSETGNLTILLGPYSILGLKMWPLFLILGTYVRNCGSCQENKKDETTCTGDYVIVWSLLQYWSAEGVDRLF